MLTYEDVIAFSDLDDAEIAEIATHAGVPAIVAAEIGRCMLDGAQNEPRLTKLLQTVTDEANAGGDALRPSHLYKTIQKVRARHQAA